MNKNMNKTENEQVICTTKDTIRGTAAAMSMGAFSIGITGAIFANAVANIENDDTAKKIVIGTGLGLMAIETGITLAAYKKLSNTIAKHDDAVRINAVTPLLKVVKTEEK